MGRNETSRQEKRSTARDFSNRMNAAKRMNEVKQDECSRTRREEKKSNVRTVVKIIIITCVIIVYGRLVPDSFIGVVVNGLGESIVHVTNPQTEPENSEAPSEEPSEAPSEEPSEAPSEEPSEAPSEAQSEAPSEEPSEAPSEEPSETHSEESHVVQGEVTSAWENNNRTFACKIMYAELWRPGEIVPEEEYETLLQTCMEVLFNKAEVKDIRKFSSNDFQSIVGYNDVKVVQDGEQIEITKEMVDDIPIIGIVYDRIYNGTIERSLPEDYTCFLPFDYFGFDTPESFAATAGIDEYKVVYNGVFFPSRCWTEWLNDRL